MKKGIMLMLLVLTACAAPASLRAQHQSNEFAPLQEKSVNYKDWTYNSLKDGKPVNLRSFAQGKKLVMVVYFAPWCGNWKNEMPVAARLYEKYKAHGFDVIGVSNYGTLDEVKKCFGEQGAPYTVVSESESREARDQTPHYDYRQKTGDKRRWGSPWNIFLEPVRLPKSGDTLAEKAWVVNGELIEAEVDKFIRERLGLPSTEAAANTASNAHAATEPVAPCEPAKLGLGKN